MANYSELLINCLEDVNKTGFVSSPRGKKVKEKISYRFEIEESTKCLSDIGPRKFPFFYQLGEIVWYMSGSLKTDYIGQFSQMWPNLVNENGDINSNYGYLVFHKKNAGNGTKTQYEYVLETLKKDKDSRQAIIHYNQAEHQIDTKDFPCTMNQQFFIRGNKLYGVSNMRSNDIIFGLTFDIVWFSLVTQSLYLDLKETYKDLELGGLIHNAGSFHFYEDFFETIDSIIENKKEIEIKDYEVILTKSLNESKDLNFEELQKESLKIKSEKDKEKALEFLKEKFGIIFKEI